MSKGLSGAVRQNALNTSDFNAAERHGKRSDRMSLKRRVSDEKPLVYGSLDLSEARAVHMKDVQQQGKTSALHLIVQFPTQMELSGDKELREKQQAAMLKHAVTFVNSYHGGDAVFAARLDRDETGQHTADVFAMPRHVFTYKDGRTQKRASVSKFSKQHALERFDKDDPRSQGRALQAAWYEYLRDEVKLSFVQPPQQKQVRSEDRLEPEAYQLKQDRNAFERYKQAGMKQLSELRRQLDETIKKVGSKLKADRADFEAERARRIKDLEADEREARIALALGRELAVKKADQKTIEQIDEVRKGMSDRQKARNKDHQM